MRPVAVDPANTDTPPECSAKCTYRRRFNGFELQRNALRSEMAGMIEPYRCGWNLKPDRIGGHDLDYGPCIFIGGAK